MDGAPSRCLVPGQGVIRVGADPSFTYGPAMTDALVLHVHIVPGADEAEQELAALYWQTAPPRAGQQVGFAHSVNELAARFRLERLSDQVAKVAHITVDSLVCQTCDQEPAAFWKRQDLRDALNSRRRTVLQCDSCIQRAGEERRARADRIAQRDKEREAAAAQWLNRWQDENEPAPEGLSSGVLLSALAMIRCDLDNPARLPWIADIHQAGNTILTLESHAVANLTNPADVLVWTSDNDAQTGGTWRPGYARLRISPAQIVAVEEEIVARRSVMAQDPEILAAAREVLLDEMVAQVNFHLQGHNLPRLTVEQREALIATLHKHPDVTLAQVINATWRAARDGAATYQQITRMPKEKATSHAVNQIAKHISPSLKPYGKPSGYDYASTTLLVFRELLDLDVLQTSMDGLADDVPADHPPSQVNPDTPGHRLTWRMVALEAGMDADLHSAARSVVENAATVFAELVADGMPETHATLVAFHGTAHLRGHVDEYHIKAARDMLHEALTRDGCLT